jgi:hypothetical protein
VPLTTPCASTSAGCSTRRPVWRWQQPGLAALTPRSNQQGADLLAAVADLDKLTRAGQQGADHWTTASRQGAHPRAPRPHAGPSVQGLGATANSTLCGSSAAALRDQRASSDLARRHLHRSSDPDCCSSTKPAVSGRRFHPQLTARLDEYEQRPARDAGRDARCSFHKHASSSAGSSPPLRTTSERLKLQAGVADWRSGRDARRAASIMAGPAAAPCGGQVRVRGRRRSGARTSRA